ncbi:MAG: Lrp/AsnC family transcriptional regulator [archaeon]
MDIARKVGSVPKTVANRMRSLEKKGIINGYYMTVDPLMFNFNTFKLLIQVQNLKNPEGFESYLSSLRNVNHISKMLGLWDYEIDCMYQNMRELQKEIEDIKNKFPNLIKKLEIIILGTRITTNKESFLL